MQLNAACLREWKCFTSLKVLHEKHPVTSKNVLFAVSWNNIRYKPSLRCHIVSPDQLWPPAACFNLHHLAFFLTASPQTWLTSSWLLQAPVAPTVTTNPLLRRASLPSNGRSLVSAFLFVLTGVKWMLYLRWSAFLSFNSELSVSFFFLPPSSFLLQYPPTTSTQPAFDSDLGLWLKNLQ